MKVDSEKSYDRPRWGVLRSFFLLLLRAYRKVLSPLMGNQCRFYPSCSAYSHAAFTYLPLVYAFWLSLWRILRCNPWNKGGLDNPPGVPGQVLKRHLESL